MRTKYQIIDCFVAEQLQGEYYSGFTRSRVFVSISLKDMINYLAKTYKEAELDNRDSKKRIYEHFTRNNNRIFLDSKDSDITELTIHKEKMLVNDKNEFSSLEFYKADEIVEIE
ncbi:hypothetical protein LS77_007430 [Helicobacter bilis]|uniref:Uncharacterized protein n=2 Tax=Helicobacter bilis TaxID=37372 RepID=N2BFI7_9HELI|nr:hypothetical protein [Helicobacter bilis]EMZ37185.1 hypothetical protein C826_02182 [Helicobacter bilis WiWa]EMZ37232.1 hypothetical protein C826_02229 [Helicobacter bilis WiWa]TLE03980.1 hypothetical protein LS77_007430 [Helicobacter bilis]TLE04705.1 hypothetical protein LS76_007470 [Helicobacter bilis]